MLGNPNFKSFEHKYFFSMNDRDDAESIPDMYARNIENWLIRNVGELEMRDGLTARGANPAKTNLGAATIVRYDGTKRMLRVIDGAANTAKFQYSSDGATWTDCSGGTGRTTGLKWVFVQANNYVYGVNGTDTPVRFDGSTITTVSGIPNGTAIEWWKNFLWIFGGAIKDRLYFSNANDPETFGGSDYVNVNLGDQSTGVGLKGTPGDTGRLYIGKARSWWYITGSDSDTFVLSPLTYEFGCASHESIIQVKNEVWGIDLEGNVRKLVRTAFDVPFGNLASSDIQSTISGINRAQIGVSTAVYFNNYALFFVPYGVDDYNSLVLVWDTLANGGKGGWLKFTGWRIARAIVFNETSPKLYLFDARLSNGQAYIWSGTSDNGNAITAKYETKIYNHGFPEREKVWKYHYQFGPVIGDVNLDFYSSVDRYYYTYLDSVNLQGTGNKLLGVTWTLGVDKLGSGGFVKEKILQSNNGAVTIGYSNAIKIEGTSSTTKLKAHRFTMHYMLRGLR